MIPWAKISTTKETADESPNYYILSPGAYTNVTDHDQEGFITGMQGSFNIKNQYNSSYYWNKGQKPYGYLNKYRKKIWQNPTQFSD